VIGRVEYFTNSLCFELNDACRSVGFFYVLMISLIFGGLAWFLTGGIDLPSIEGIKDFFKSEKSTKTTKSKKSKYGHSEKNRGRVIDSYKGVDVYYNGRVANVSGRNTTKDGYNLGLKYQCVEFAKRFFYEAYDHKMPDSYGHAKDFYNRTLASGAYNKARGMYQYKNGGSERPRPDDLVIIGASPSNGFGHLFIITKVTRDAVEFIQQNPGSNNPSRGRFPLRTKDNRYFIEADQLVGWLRIG